MTATQQETGMTYHTPQHDTEALQVTAFHPSGDYAGKTADVHMAPGSEHFDMPVQATPEQNGEQNGAEDVEQSRVAVYGIQRFALFAHDRKMQMSLPGTIAVLGGGVIEHPKEVSDEATKEWKRASSGYYRVKGDGDPVYPDESPIALYDDEDRLVQPDNDNKPETSAEDDNFIGFRQQIQQQHKGVGSTNGSHRLQGEAMTPIPTGIETDGSTGLVFKPIARPVTDPNTPQQEYERVMARGADMDVKHFAPLPVAQEPIGDPALNLMNIINGKHRPEPPQPYVKIRHI